MRRWFTLVLGAVFSLPAQVVISQVYGGGGNAGATLRNDFIEIFNRGASTVSLAGWSVQYAAAGGATWQGTTLGGALGPGQYYLVQESAGAGGTVNLPPPDATGNIAMSATSGKVALLDTSTTLAGACPSGGGVQDLVGYGAGATCFEGADTAPTLTNTTAALRGGAGCTDTNNNAADFASGAPDPRNTASPLRTCGGPPVIQTTSPLPTAIQSNFYSLTFTAFGGTGTLTWSVGMGSTLPVGLSLAGDTLSGVPSGAGTLSFAIRVTDTLGLFDQRTFQLTVSGAVCNPTHTIAQIQGSGSASPLAGAAATTTGIVTGRKSNGFFLQMPAPGDGNAATSDGLFAFTGAGSPLLAAAVIGNSVCVSGTIQEFAPASDPNSPTLTEFSPTSSVFTLAAGQPLPPPVVLTAADTDQLERYEGMRVQVNSLTVVQPTGSFRNEPNATSTSDGVFYGVIAGVARPFREPGIPLPDPLPAGAPLTIPRFDANPERLRVDSDAQPGTTPLDVATGATVINLAGPLDYGARTYTIDPDAATPPSASGGLSAAVAVPAPGASELTVGSFNLERFFDTTNDPATSDAVLTVTAFNNRLNKASLAIRNVMQTPDILGVQEVENLATLQALAGKINADAVAAGRPSPNYQSYLVEGNDPGGIDSGFLVKAGRVSVVAVTQEGKTATFIDPIDSSVDLLNDRPPLVLTATVAQGGVTSALTVIVNHLRSFLGIDDPATGARIRAKRRAQAEFLAGLIQARQAANPGEYIASIGDYNAFQFNDGYVDSIGTIQGTPAPASEVVLASRDLVNPDLTNLVDASVPAAERYSYVFGGSAQVLDHVIVNRQLVARVSRMHYARNNADFPEVLRGNAARPERISDHDMPVAYFQLPFPSSPRPLPAVTSVSAASFAPGGALAPGAIASAFGPGLAAATGSAATVPLPTALAGTSVRIRDSAGAELPAPLFFVSASQINYLVPEGVRPGTATVTVVSNGRNVAQGNVQIEAVAPGLFTANADGRGVPAAVAQRVGDGGTLPVFQCGSAPGSCVPVALDLGEAGDQVILILFGTGIRGRSGLGGVSVRIGGAAGEVLYAGPQGSFVGLDQVNVRVPRSLIGRGEVDLVLAVDGRGANLVRVSVR